MLVAPADRSTMNAKTQVGLFLQDACTKATIPDAEVLRFTRQHESPTVFLVSSPRLADRSVFCVCLWVCACARQKEKGGGGGAEANSPLSVGLCVRCFQQQANWFCTYCERKLWVFRVLSPLNALLLLLHSWGEWGKMEQGMLFKSQTSKRGGDGVRVCVCVRARESKHDTTVDCLGPFVFILFFKYEPDVMFVIFSCEINIYVSRERVAPIPFVCLFIYLLKETLQFISS